MKKTGKGVSSIWAIGVLLMGLLTACEKEIVDEATPVSAANSTLKVATRAGSDGGVVNYPVAVYVMDDADKCVATSTIGSDGEALSFKLPEGVFAVYAIGGADAARYTLPTEASAAKTSAITLKDGATNTNLMAAKNAVTMKADETNTLTLALQNKTMELQSVTIKSVPAEVTAVSVTLSPLHNHLLLDGSYSAAATDSYEAQLAKQADGTTWTNTAKAYLLEAASGATVKVSMTYPGGGNQLFLHLPGC